MDSNYPDWCCDEDSRRALYRQPDRVMAAMIRSDTIDEIEQLERKLEGLYLLRESLDEAAQA